MIIQTITLEGIFGRYWGWHTFQKITDNDNNVIEYTHNGKDGLTKEEVDKIYRELKSYGEKMKLEHTTKNITIDEYIKQLDNSIDKYYMYIDNGKQYDEAVAHNAHLYKKIEQYEALKENGVE
jgi:hypothetical protein